MTWGTSSTDVKFEGKGVARFSDVTQHNNNTYNTMFISDGSPNTAFAYADDFDGVCEICEKGPAQHRIHETKNTAEKCKEVIDGLMAKLKSLLSSARTAKAQNNLVMHKSTLEQIDKLAGSEHEVSESGNIVTVTYYGGYMVGVMLCKCGQYFAAKSGANHQPFEDIAKSKGCEVIPGRSVRRGKLIAVNAARSASDTQKKKAIAAAWQKALDNSCWRVRMEQARYVCSDETSHTRQTRTSGDVRNVF
jgi:hypothetical protein